MTIKELKTKISKLPDDMIISVFANGNIYDVFETQLRKEKLKTEFELGCGWVTRDDDSNEDGITFNF